MNELENCQKYKKVRILNEMCNDGLILVDTRDKKAFITIFTQNTYKMYDLDHLRTVFIGPLFDGIKHVEKIENELWVVDRVGLHLCDRMTIKKSFNFGDLPFLAVQKLVLLRSKQSESEYFVIVLSETSDIYKMVCKFSQKIVLEEKSFAQTTKINVLENKTELKTTDDENYTRESSLNPFNFNLITKNDENGRIYNIFSTKHQKNLLISREKSISIVDVSKNEKILTAATSEKVLCCAFAGYNIFLGTESGKILLFTQEGTILNILDRKSSINHIAHQPSQKTIGFVSQSNFFLASYEDKIEYKHIENVESAAFCNLNEKWILARSKGTKMSDESKEKKIEDGKFSSEKSQSNEKDETKDEKLKLQNSTSLETYQIDKSGNFNLLTTRSVFSEQIKEIRQFDRRNLLFFGSKKVFSESIYKSEQSFEFKSRDLDIKFTDVRDRILVGSPNAIYEFEFENKRSKKLKTFSNETIQTASLTECSNFVLFSTKDHVYVMNFSSGIIKVKINQKNIVKIAGSLLRNTLICLDSSNNLRFYDFSGEFIKEISINPKKEFKIENSDEQVSAICRSFKIHKNYLFIFYETGLVLIDLTDMKVLHSFTFSDETKQPALNYDISPDMQSLAVVYHNRVEFRQTSTFKLQQTVYGTYRQVLFSLTDEYIILLGNKSVEMYSNLDLFKSQMNQNSSTIEFKQEIEFNEDLIAETLAFLEFERK